MTTGARPCFAQEKPAQHPSVLLTHHYAPIADLRAKLVRYTSAGRAQDRKGVPPHRDLEQRFVDELGEDHEAARRVLERIVGILGEEAGD